MPGTPTGYIAVPNDLRPPPELPQPTAPSDVLSGASVAAAYAENETAQDAALAALARIDPARSLEVRHILDVLRSPVPDADFSDPGTRIVVLGNGLNADGSVHPNLERRLEVAAELHREHPAARILASGGTTDSGHVESDAMKAWLVDRGIEDTEVSTERYSWSTVSNAWNTEVLYPGKSPLVVATSASHLHRAVVDFALAYGPDVRVTGAAAPDIPPVSLDVVGNRSDRYRDAMLWYLVPKPIIADGLPPLLGPGIARFF